MTDALTDAAPIVVVTRWTRYGKDRAYAAIADVQIGYRDLHTGDVVCEQAGLAATLERATDALWQAARAKRYVPRHADPTLADRVATPDPAPLEVPLLPDRDLGANLPGEAVGARAKELREAAPVRTRVQRLLGVKTDERAWRIGGDAEKAVAKRLAGLGPEWRVLHAIPVGDRGSDIDHLVIGPAGVFTVNAKNHPDANVWVRGDTVKVNGFSRRYVPISRHEAARAAKLLTARVSVDVDVRGLVAIMGMERGFTVVEQPRDGLVAVVQRRRVADHLRSLPVVLDAPSIERIHDVARHLATWQPRTVAWSDDL